MLILFLNVQWFHWQYSNVLLLSLTLPYKIRVSLLRIKSLSQTKGTFQCEDIKTVYYRSFSFIMHCILYQAQWPFQLTSQVAEAFHSTLLFIFLLTHLSIPLFSQNLPQQQLALPCNFISSLLTTHFPYQSFSFLSRTKQFSLLYHLKISKGHLRFSFSFQPIHPHFPQQSFGYEQSSFQSHQFQLKVFAFIPPKKGSLYSIFPCLISFCPEVIGAHFEYCQEGESLRGPILKLLLLCYLRDFLRIIIVFLHHPSYYLWSQK